MTRDLRPVVHFPYLYLLMGRVMRPRAVLDLELSVEDEGHYNTALAIAHDFGVLLGSGVVRTRENISSLGTTMAWLPDAHIEPEECARVYAPGVDHTRLILHLGINPEYRMATALGSRTQAMAAVRDLILGAGGRLRELELLCLESLDNLEARMAYHELYGVGVGRYPPDRYRGQILLHARKDMRSALGALQDYWRKPGVLDRVLATDAANQSLPQTGAIFELHTQLSVIEHLIVREVILSSAFMRNRNIHHALRVTKSTLMGSCRITDFDAAVLHLAALGWLGSAIQQPLGWEVTRGPKLAGVDRADLVGL